MGQTMTVPQVGFLSGGQRHRIFDDDYERDPNVVHILDLPKETIAHIGCFLNCEERARMRQVCRAMREVFSDAIAWENNFIRINSRISLKSCQGQIAASKKLRGAFVREQGREKEVKSLLEKHKDTIQFLSFTMMTDKFVDMLPRVRGLKSLEIKFAILDEKPCFKNIKLNIEYLYITGYMATPIMDLIKSCSHSLKRVSFGWAPNKPFCETTVISRAMLAVPTPEYIMMRPQHCHTPQCDEILSDMRSLNRRLNFKCDYCTANPVEDCFCTREKKAAAEEQRKLKRREMEAERRRKLESTIKKIKQKQKELEEQEERRRERERQRIEQDEAQRDDEQGEVETQYEPKQQEEAVDENPGEDEDMTDEEEEEGDENDEEDDEDNQGEEEDDEDEEEDGEDDDEEDDDDDDNDEDDDDDDDDDDEEDDDEEDDDDDEDDEENEAGKEKREKEKKEREEQKKRKDEAKKKQEATKPAAKRGPKETMVQRMMRQISRVIDGQMAQLGIPDDTQNRDPASHCGDCRTIDADREFNRCRKIMLHLSNRPQEDIEAKVFDLRVHFP